MKTTFEYKEVPFIGDELNQLGAEGWEVVSVSNGTAFLKRAVVVEDQIDVLAADPNHPAFPMGIQLVSIDNTRTRWTIVEGKRKARVNRNGAWCVAGFGMSEDFVFTLEEARVMAAHAIKEAEELVAADPPSTP